MNTQDHRIRSSSGQAVERLRELIFSGQLGAGSDHLESELAESLGMSRTPVREALLVLEGQGLVDVRPRKGVRIKPLSPVDMAEIYDVLTELESLAAANAAREGYSADDLQQLEHTINLMDSALEENDRGAWARADDAFHAELVQLGRNSRVEAIAQMMSDQVRRARLVTLHMRPVPNRSNEDHRAVLDAIAAGDADTAARVHREHRTAAKKVIVDLLETHHLSSV
ncbi:MAG: GntR family transcriptional regulator [Litoreibacter sp.]|nr:GntR family transcriptional regulator [Litoreibacter sp.]MCY4335312.1 GntR family transcriptional regulator [Litoreibacter sp.]